MTNPPAVGGAGVASRSRSSPARSPRARDVHVTARASWDNTTDAGKALTASRRPGLEPNWPLGLPIEDWTTYPGCPPSPARARASSPPPSRSGGCRHRRVPDHLPVIRHHPRADDRRRPPTSCSRRRGIAKHYGAVAALRSASLAVRPGEVHALMGANGAGKSTLVKILTGAVRPDARDDRASTAGRARRHSPAEARRGGIVSVYQEPALVPDLDIARQPAPDPDAGRAVPPLAVRARARRTSTSTRPRAAARDAARSSTSPGRWPSSPTSSCSTR